MDYVGTTCQQYDMGGLIMCNNCIHKPVCAKYTATGGHVNKCEHHREERKGKWITDEKGTTYCGRCRHIDDYASVHNYCPICGCDMRGAEDG